jgi:hypothetical protein
MVGASVILGGATALASGISAIVNFQQAKTDAKAAEAAAKRLMGMQEVDKMAALQAPDIAALSRQQTAQQTASATQSLQGMGPEAAIGGVANLYQAGREAEAQTAQQQAMVNLDVETAKAQSAQNIEYRNLERRRELEAARLAGAQQSAADRRAAGMAGIEGAFAGVGMLAQGLIGESDTYGGNK